MWEIDLIGPIIFSKYATSIPESHLFGRVTSFGSLICVLDKHFFSFLGTSSIKIFLLFLWNGHFNCLHFTSYMVCSMDIYWSGKDYFGTHLFVVYAKLWLWSMQIIFSWLKCFPHIYDSDLMSLIWSLHWRFSHHTTL